MRCSLTPPSGSFPGAWTYVRSLLLILLLLPLATNAQPNVIVILADDLNAEAMNELVGGGVVPNIKTYLIDQGVNFTNSFVTTAECCPSRATLLTGRYSHNHRVISNMALNPVHGGIAWPGWLNDGVNAGQEDSTIAVWLRNAGYRTGFVGKYLNGYGEYAPPGVSDARTYVPPGWDRWDGLLSPSMYSVYDYSMNQNGTIVQYGSAATDYQTDVLAERAVSFVEESLSTQAPFFLLIAPLAPHVEVNIDDLIGGAVTTSAFGLTIRPAPRHLYLIDGNESNGEFRVMPIKPNFNELDVSDKPSCPRPPPPNQATVVAAPYCVQEHPPITTLLEVARINFQRKSMMASILAVDEMLGRLVASLTAQGKLDDTLLVFTSDNGWFYGEHRLSGKSLAYEESIRVPLYVRAPGGRAGVQAPQLVINNDLAPTIADFGGVLPGSVPDGSSLRPLLDVAPTVPWFNRKRFLVERWFIPSFLKYEAPTYLALRTLSGGQNYVYIATRSDPANFPEVTDTELYDLNIDRFQLNSVSLPEATAANMNYLLTLFRSCSGLGCRAFESF